MVGISHVVAYLVSIVEFQTRGRDRYLCSSSRVLAWYGTAREEEGDERHRAAQHAVYERLPDGSPHIMQHSSEGDAEHPYLLPIGLQYASAIGHGSSKRACSNGTYQKNHDRYCL